MTDWLVIVCNTRHERRAMQGLKDAGFEVWCPMRVVEFRSGRERWWACRLYPALPGYVLARGPDWRQTFGIDGVRGVLAVDWRPLCPTRAEVERLHRQFDLTPAPIIEDAYQIGQDVRVTMSPTGQFDGVVERHAKGGRLVVLGSVMGRMVQIEVDRRQVKRKAA